MKINPPSGLRCEFLNAAGLPVLVQAIEASLTLERCAQLHRQWIDDLLLVHGAILFRDFAMDDPVAEFGRFSEAVTGSLLDYVYRSTPRTALGEKIYSATEYPAKSVIPQHNENAYSRSWPLRIMFLCVQPSLVGGCTPLSSTAGVSRRIAAEVREKFKRLGVKYVRNYRDSVDLPWQTVFQTDKQGEVEAYCKANDIEFEWKPDGSLRTAQVCQGMAVHPLTKEELWFNQAHLFHASSLDKANYAALLSLYKEEEFPRNTYYGDGSPIEPEVLEHIRSAFEAERVTFRWKKNDVLLADNMLVGHGREPFSGPRKILVTMGDAYSPPPVGN